MIRIIGLVAATTLLAGCGGGADEPASEPPSPRPSKIVMTLAPGVEPKSTDYELGQKADLDDLTAEVVEYRRDVEPKATNEPGERKDAALIRMCNDLVLADDALSTFSSYNWEARDDDEGSYQRSGVTYRQSPSPQFPGEKQLPVGECAKGWVIWDLPEKATVTKIAFVRDGADVATWGAAK